jgi:hypothetical protein
MFLYVFVAFAVGLNVVGCGRSTAIRPFAWSPREGGVAG